MPDEICESLRVAQENHKRRPALLRNLRFLLYVSR